MKLSRRDFVPALAIVAGGVIGGTVSFSFLLLSRSDQVPAPEPAAPSAIAETLEAPRLEEQRYRYVVRMQDIEARRRVERDRMERVEEIREVFIIDSDVRIR